MAKQTNDYNPTGFRISCATLTAADGTSAKIIVTAAEDDSTISQFTISSTDTVDRDVEILLDDGTANYLLTTVIVPAEAGADGFTPPFNVLGLPFVYNAMIPLMGGISPDVWSISVRAKVEVAGTMTFCVILADY